MRGHHHLPISGRLIGQLATGSETPLDQFHKTIENNRSETVSWHNTSDAQVPPADLPAALLFALMCRCAGMAMASHWSALQHWSTFSINISVPSQIKSIYQSWARVIFLAPRHASPRHVVLSTFHRSVFKKKNSASSPFRVTHRSFLNVS